MILLTSITSPRFHILPASQGSRLRQACRTETQSRQPASYVCTGQGEVLQCDGLVQSLFCSQELPRARSPCQVVGTQLATSVPAASAQLWTTPARPRTEISSSHSILGHMGTFLLSCSLSREESCSSKLTFGEDQQGAWGWLGEGVLGLPAEGNSRT